MREEAGLQETQLARAPDRLAAGGDLQLAEDAVGVGLDGADRDREAPGDLGVGPAGDEQPEHLPFARAHRREARRGVPDTGTRTVRANVPRSDTGPGRVV